VDCHPELGSLLSAAKDATQRPGGLSTEVGKLCKMEILLIEDNQDDVLLIRLAVAEASATASLRVARNGEEAIAILEDPDFLPSLIILDLNIPRVAGPALLERWRGGAIPVVVFSSSQSEAEKARVLKLGAREFVHKPSDLDEFVGAVGLIVERWGEGQAGTVSE
jgi:DNA-binding response OmpR family regulator